MRITVAPVNAYVTSGHCMFECCIHVYCQMLQAGNPLSFILMSSESPCLFAVKFRHIFLKQKRNMPI